MSCSFVGYPIVYLVNGQTQDLTALLRGCSCTLDGYYKEVPGIYAFDMNNYYGFSERIQQGTGNAQGLELLLNGKVGNFPDWMSYSHAGATRKFSGSEISQGRVYDFDST